MKWRKKPVEIEAIQYNGNNGEELRQWSNGAVIESPVIENWESYVQIKTLEGTMTGLTGDWIIKGVKGEFYPCKPDIFQATYEQSAPDKSVEQRAKDCVDIEYENWRKDPTHLRKYFI